MKIHLKSLTIFLILIMLTSLFGCSTTNDYVSTLSESQSVLVKSNDLTISDPLINNSVKAKFIRIVDGDTLKVELDGKEESVRLLLIDTPETKHPQLGEQPFGDAASDFAKEFFSRADYIILEFDEEKRDHYNRILAYVWVNGVMYNEEVVKEGLSRVGYIYESKKHLDRLLKAQEEAKIKGTNIWGIKGYVGDEGYNDMIYTNDEETFFSEDSEKSEGYPNSKEKEYVANSSECNIKGNITSSGDKIYHLEGGSSYNRTNAEEMFCSEEEAIAAGYRKSQR